MTALLGRDVSNYQCNYNWAAVKNCTQFGFAKATEGLEFQDSYFQHNWYSMWWQKILRGAYHFGHPGLDPVAQAQFFYTTVAYLGFANGDAVALDLECTDGENPGQVAKWAVAFCKELISLAKKKPFIYTNHDFINNGCCAGLYDYPLWIAAWTQPGNPGSIYPWSVWSIQQYTSDPVDLDIFNGSVNTWQILTKAQ